jgi:hypothetical protein
MSPGEFYSREKRARKSLLLKVIPVPAADLISQKDRDDATNERPV